MDHQDFTPVVLYKNKPKSKQSSPSLINSKKTEYDGLVEKPKTFPREFGSKLASLRSSSNLNRKDLALKLNVKESVVSDIENGKHIYDGNIVHKLKKLFPSL
jgi:ribosome-binding protein aMBF1 (putative translation factor)